MSHPGEAGTQGEDLAVTAAPQVHISRELELERQPGLGPGTLTRDAVFPRDVFTADQTPTSHFQIS